MIAVCAWLVYCLLLFGVLWVRGVAPWELSAEPREARGRHAGPAETGWRRRGSPVVPLSLAGFLLFMAGASAFEAHEYAKEVQRFASGTVTTRAEVVGRKEPPWISKKSARPVVRFDASGRTIVTAVPHPGGFDVGDILEVRYLTSDPDRAQSTAAGREDRSDQLFWARSRNLCLGFAGIAAIGWAVGRLRRRPGHR